MVTDKYRSGLAREAVAMRMKGISDEKIARSLGVDRGFVLEAWTKRYENMPERAQTAPEVGDMVGGY